MEPDVKVNCAYLLKPFMLLFHLTLESLLTRKAIFQLRDPQINTSVKLLNLKSIRANLSSFVQKLSAILLREKQDF